MRFIIHVRFIKYYRTKNDEINVIIKSGVNNKKLNYVRIIGTSTITK